MVLITYTSVLAPTSLPELEALLFFNPNQHRVRETIVSAIEEFGIPRVELQVDRLRVRLEGGNEVQTLFAMAEEPQRTRLAGVAVYTRVDATTLLLLHLAVRKEYSANGANAGQMLVLRFFAQLRDIAARINGVRTLRIFYGQGSVRDIPVPSLTPVSP